MAAVGAAPVVDPLQGVLVPVNNTVALGSVNISQQDGSFVLNSPLQPNVSPAGAAAAGYPLTGSPVGLPLSLSYASSTVNVDPIVATTFDSSVVSGTITLLQNELDWNGGGYGTAVTFGTSGHSAGDVY
jgi:hypothetical protein